MHMYWEVIKGNFTWCDIIFITALEYGTNSRRIGAPHKVETCVWGFIASYGVSHGGETRNVIF
jgi:hypothetical protein